MIPLPPVLIDIYNHVMPLRYLEALKVHGTDPGMVKRMTNLTMLWDIEARVQMLEKWPHVQQVLSLSVPSPEMLLVCERFRLISRFDPGAAPSV